MAVALDKKGNVVGVGLTLTVPAPFSVTAGGVNRAIVAVIGQGLSATGPTGVTWGGVALTQVDTGTTNGNLHSSWWYLVNPVAGGGPLVATWAASTQAQISATSWTGVHQTTPVGTMTKATGTSAAPATAQVTNTAGDAVIDIMCSVTTTNPESGNGTLIFLGAITRNQYNIATNPTPSWTLAASVVWAMSAVALKSSSDTSPPVSGPTTVSLSELRIVPMRAAPWGFSQWQDPAQQNLIPNGSFEAASDISGWQYQGSTGSLSWISGGVVGTHCMRVNCTNAGVIERVIQVSPATTPTGTFYTWEGWVRPANNGQVSMTDVASTTTPVGNGTTWYYLTSKNNQDSNLGFIETTAGSGTFSVDDVRAYAQPAMIENNAAAWEASSMFPKVLGFTVDGSGNMVWEDIWTLPSVAPAGACAVTAMPTPNSPNGSFVATTQDGIFIYPLPFNFDPTETAYPRLATSTSSATYGTDLVPIHYPSAIDLGTGLYELVALACVGANFTYETDAWGYSFRWDETQAWSTVQFLAQPNATFTVQSSGYNRGSVLHLAISIYDAANTDPIGPYGRHIVAWVRKLAENASDIRQVAVAIPAAS